MLYVTSWLLVVSPATHFRPHQTFITELQQVFVTFNVRFIWAKGIGPHRYHACLCVPTSGCVNPCVKACDCSPRIGRFKSESRRPISRPLVYRVYAASSIFFLETKTVLYV